MKIKHINKDNEEKVYEYPTTSVMILLETREKIRELAKNDGRTIVSYLERLINKEHKKLK